ncbi:MAG: GNAT family N-acetyltransferase [Candidatus Thermoplasmatota archaeon]
MEQDEVIIRNGEEKDLEDFFELYWISSLEHIAYNETLDALKSKEKCREVILADQRKALKDENHFFLVAEKKGKVIGMITSHVGERDDDQIYAVEKMGFIDQFCVHPNYRHLGIGRRLLTKLLQEMDNRDVLFVGVGVAYKNPVIEFYQAHGFSAEGLWMVRGKGDNKPKKDGRFHRYDPYGRGKATIPFTVKVKSKQIMGEYIALHGLVPQNELPEHLRYQIPVHEIWIREDVYVDEKRREEILEHEKYELALMETRGCTYKEAHARAEIHEKIYRLQEELEKAEKSLNAEPFEPIKLVDPTPQSKIKDIKEQIKKSGESSTSTDTTSASSQEKKEEPKKQEGITK